MDGVAHLGRGDRRPSDQFKRNLEIFQQCIAEGMAGFMVNMVLVHGKGYTI